MKYILATFDSSYTEQIERVREFLVSIMKEGDELIELDSAEIKNIFAKIQEQGYTAEDHLVLVDYGDEFTPAMYETELKQIGIPFTHFDSQTIDNRDFERKFIPEERIHTELA